MAVTGLVLALASAFSAGYAEGRVQAVREFGRPAEAVVVDWVDPWPFFDNGAVDVRFGSSAVPQVARIWLRSSPPPPAIDSRVQIRYDPTDPARACLPEHCQLSRLPNTAAVVVFIAGILLLLVGGTRSVRDWRRRRRAPLHPPGYPPTLDLESRPYSTRAELLAQLNAYGDVASADDARLHVGAPAQPGDIQTLLTRVLPSRRAQRFFLGLQAVVVFGGIVGVYSGVIQVWVLLIATAGLALLVVDAWSSRRGEQAMRRLVWHQVDLVVLPIRTDWPGCTVVALRPRTPGVIRPVLAIIAVELTRERTGESRPALVTRGLDGDWWLWAADWPQPAEVHLLEADDEALDDLRW